MAIAQGWFHFCADRTANQGIRTHFGTNLALHKGLRRGSFHAPLCHVWCVIPMPRRYAVREVAPDKWTVYDIFTGWPAKVDGNRMTNIESWEANEFAELLNQQDLTRRAKAGISGLWFQPPTSAPPG